MIRTLRKGDATPPGEPSRYLSDIGYVRLRWLVAPNEYVETYEHRLVMGLPDGHVHHIDGDKTNNDPSNLEILTASEHQHRHDDQLREAGRYKGSARARAAAERKAAMDALWAEIAARHAAGESTPELGRAYGRHHTNISRGLHSRGYWVRPRVGSA